MAGKPSREEELRAARGGKLAELRAAGWAWPNDFRPTHRAAELHAAHDAAAADALPAEELAVAGRMMLKRVQGKTSFVQLQDESGRVQLMALRERLGDAAYAEFRRWDLGDIIGARGALMKTRTGELTVRVRELRLLGKALRPPPEKFHGLHDIELRYRRRHLDLLANEHVRTLFRRRSRLLAELRRLLDERGFLEVETPLLHPVAGGAAARPFVTRHEALRRDLYLRVAPELYLKRLVIGGFERVFELNRSFRNEGLSTQHNPEFTMLELYQAHADYRDLMRLLEELLPALARVVLGGTRVRLPSAAGKREDEEVDEDEGIDLSTVLEQLTPREVELDLSVVFEQLPKEIDLSAPFEQLTLREVLRRYCIKEALRLYYIKEVLRQYCKEEKPNLDDAVDLAAEYARFEIDILNSESVAMLQRRLYEHVATLRQYYIKEKEALLWWYCREKRLNLDDAADLAAECGRLEIDILNGDSVAMLQRRLYEHVVEKKLDLMLWWRPYEHVVEKKLDLDDAADLAAECGRLEIDILNGDSVAMLQRRLYEHVIEKKLDLDDAAALATECVRLEIDAPGGESAAMLQLRLFEHAVEPTLKRPTFVTEYPVEASPLARRCDHDPERAERFELFAAGRELANGFSELNDPEDQAERFRRQAELRAGGDPEAMRYDEEYVRALEHGLPPTAGVGVGIDRLAMLLCGERSIREVLLFPQLRAVPDEA